MSDLSNRFEAVKSRIKAATAQAERVNCPQLLAVSKKHERNKIEALAALGQLAFGESYVQEGVEKINQLEALCLEWHFIGPIQSNKAKSITEHFDWVHSVDRLKILKRLNQHRPEGSSPLNVLLQIKIGDEQSKSGASHADVINLAETAEAFANIQLRGVMCIPPASDDFDVQCGYFQQAKKVFDELSKTYPHIDTLSMGMSGDLEAAIHCGSTVVRIGTDIFGPRPA